VALHWSDVSSPWRIFTPLRALRGYGYEVDCTPMQQPPADLKGTDLLVLQSPGSAAALNVIDTARRQGSRVVVDVDDLFTPEAVRTSWVDEDRLSAPGSGAQASAQDTLTRTIAYFYACLRRADAVTVTTERLAEAYSAFNRNVYILPNCYDDANPFWKLAPPARATVNIGFAGANTHADNVAVLHGALEPILQAHPDVRILEAGGLQLLPHINSWADRLVHLGRLPFDAFPLLLRQMDIVLAPLSDLPFMRCKSNIRCMTAGLVGAPVVASPVWPYATYVKHGHNGFLAGSRAEWTDALERLVSDHALRQRMGDANRQQAQTYAISANIHRWTDVYAGLVSRRHALVGQS
jgi:glycosyltransferase involved in cell wall biosynthesis